MATLLYNGSPVPVRAGDNLLDSLLAASIDAPHSCRAGVCQSCLIKVVSGNIPPTAQKGLRETLATQGFALACRFTIDDHLSIRSAGAMIRADAIVMDSQRIGPGIIRLRLKPLEPFEYVSGQYLTLWNPQGQGRAYSIASVPARDDFIELHVRHYPGGAVSSWVADTLAAGERVSISGPVGNCHYLPGNASRPLLLAGTGTGLAPLLGILRDALARGHANRIVLLHGAGSSDGLYLNDELAALADRTENMTYRGLLHGEPESLETTVLAMARDMQSPCIYLCGNDDFVHRTRRQLFVAGLPLHDIHADSFIPGSATPHRTNPKEVCNHD